MVLEKPARLKPALVDRVEADQVHFDHTKTAVKHLGDVPGVHRFADEGVGQPVEQGKNISIDGRAILGDRARAVSVERHSRENVVFKAVHSIFPVNRDTLLQKPDLINGRSRWRRAAS